ncbi:hypothetical protein GF366_04145 [Candidatus Peregrinibacteria bacterium]|nr:hypothetical protein [Candidatus Peregrinibacteria bacterium]
MKKIKKTLTYSFGAFIAFLFSKSTTLAQVPMYGVELPEEPTLWEKILSIVLSPLFITIMVAIVLVTGTIIFIKRKRKNAQKNS